MADPRTARRRLSAAVLATALSAVLVGCGGPVGSASPSQTTGPTPSATATATPTPLPTATPEPPLSLAAPEATDARQVRYSVTAAVPANGNGKITVKITSLATNRIDELVLRWPTPLDATLYLAPFTPSTSRLTDALVQPWTKWVVGPGEMGEPAGTTSLGWGPLLPGATLTIPIVVTRRASGPVAFDLQVLAGEALLTDDNGGPAETRVSIP